MVSAWMVRAGKDGEREDEALGRGLIIVGWHEVGDLSSYPSRDDLREAVRRAFPAAGNALVANWAGQLWRFVTEIQADDLVVTPLKSRKVAVGRVLSSYEFRADAEPGLRHIRAVNWLQTGIPRGTIQQDLLNSMGSLLTVCGLNRNGAARRIAELADRGIDPGPEPDEVPAETAATPYAFLEDAARRPLSNPVRVSIRELLGKWGMVRRGPHAVARLEDDLAEQGLTTRPPFTEGWIDTTVELVPVGKEPGSESGSEDLLISADTTDISELPPITLRVGDLESAAGGVASVQRTDPLRTATTLMAACNFSQLAVLDEDGTLLGAVSWESIGRARIAKAYITIREATIPTRAVHHEEGLISEIHEIYERGYVFVRGLDARAITGIVTAADLTKQFGSLVRPFVLVEEAERRLRRRVDEVFSIAEIKAASPRPNRITSAADLTLGNYEHLLRDAGNWRRMCWQVDHNLFIRLLLEVRDIRNDLIHFTPDPFTAEQLQKIGGFVDLLRAVDPGG
jgi:restriction system protein